jgi:signal transduction histidine kinase
VSERWIRPTCVALLVGAWLLDLVTPQLFVAAILLNGPIALSSLALDSHLTRRLVVAALVANVTAAYVNGVHDGYHWDPIAIGDRIISGLSFLLVGGLSIATQTAAARAGELAARRRRERRERSVRRAVETIRGSVNPELIRRAVVREALAALDVDGAYLYAFESTIDEPTTYIARAGGDVETRSERPPGPLPSLLLRVTEGRAGTVRVRASEAVGRLVLETLCAQHAIAAPIVEHASTFGVLLLVRDGRDFEPRFEEGLDAYVAQVASALAQARLFVQLAARNDELAAANAALRERGDVIRDIVYALSHDLRTPLAAARMTMEQALADAYGPLPDAYRAILRRTIASNEELKRLAETLLLVSRYESGDATTHRERVALAPLAAGVVAELEPLWRGNEVAVDLEVESDEAIAGDERDVRRALVNLIANAVAWTPPGRRVVVRVDRAGDRVRVVVDDEGFGIPPADRASLFERVRATPARAGSGSGLGLYLVRRIAESHGGSVAYEPRPGGGSRFVLAFPLVARAQPVVSA